MHSSPVSVYQIQQGIFIHADVVRLHMVFTEIEFRYVVSYFFGPERVGKINGSQPGIEVGEENDVFPRTICGGVFQNVMGAETATSMHVLFPVRHIR